MKKRCEVCGKTYEPHNNKQRFCSQECSHAHKLEYLREYRRRDEVKARHREANRSYMQTAREEQKRQEAEKAEKEARFIGLNYAERQMAQTLAMVGKVEV